MKGLERIFLVLVMVPVLMVSACSNPLDSSSTDGLEFTPQPLGMDLCYDCHNVPGSVQAYEQVFEEWLASRHANFSVGYFPPVDPFTMRDTFGVLRTYDEITGGPSLPGPSYLAGCMPCHNGGVVAGDVGGAILDTLTYGALFTDPILGEIARPIIDCEACHISGTGHFGGSSPPEVAIPGFNQCTECHPPTPSLLEAEPFAGAAHTDHHGPSSTHMWAYGDTVVDDLLTSGDPSPIVETTLAIASNSFEAYIISAGWLAANGGSWFFDGHETINDTHYQGIWITNEPNQLVVYEKDSTKLGYVDLSNASPNTGMVRADSVDSCTASCHGAHEFDLTINEQWFEGAHHPQPEGPIVSGRNGPELDGSESWGAVDHVYGAGCLRCHTSMGFAEVAPGYGDAVQTPAEESDGFITCNACHDGVNYPTPEDKSLRFSGSVALYDYQGVPLANVQAGASAVCVYCHQGREDGSHIDDDIADNAPQFQDMHYLPAGATLYGMKGYEYPGKSYAGEHTFHVLAGCTGCHMAEDDPPLDDVGGHTFHMANVPAGGATIENTAFCEASCHPTMSALDNPGVARTVDWSGIGPASAKNEVAYLLTVLLHNAIEAYDGNNDATPDVYYLGGYPYFQLYHLDSRGNPIDVSPEDGIPDYPTQTWEPATAKAVFNWQFLHGEPGAYAHNPKYAVQLLRDSYNDLAYAQSLAGAPSIPSLGGTRP